jgi:hypothetical protein
MYIQHRMTISGTCVHRAPDADVMDEDEKAEAAEEGAKEDIPREAERAEAPEEEEEEDDDDDDDCKFSVCVSVCVCVYMSIHALTITIVSLLKPAHQHTHARYHKAIRHVPSSSCITQTFLTRISYNDSVASRTRLGGIPSTQRGT